MRAANTAWFPVTACHHVSHIACEHAASAAGTYTWLVHAQQLSIISDAASSCLLVIISQLHAGVSSDAASALTSAALNHQTWALLSQQTRDIEPTLVQCLVFDGRWPEVDLLDVMKFTHKAAIEKPAMKTPDIAHCRLNVALFRHWLDAFCLLGDNLFFLQQLPVLHHAIQKTIDKDRAWLIV